jgi:hypothetical protein
MSLQFLFRMERLMAHFAVVLLLRILVHLETPPFVIEVVQALLCRSANEMSR